MAHQPDATPYLAHSDPIDARGFITIPNVVVTDEKLSVAARLLYGYLGHLAWRSHDPEIEVPLKVIADSLSVSLRSLNGYMAELREAGLVESVRRGRGMTNGYVINRPTLQRRTADSAGGDRQISQIPARARSLPFVESKARESATHSAASANPADRPGSVNRIKVTDAEYELAHNAMQHFNRVAGTRYSSKDWTGKVIMRIREHPEVTLPQHRQVIERAFASPWWKGPSSPSVIYGSAAQFDRSLHAVDTAPVARALTPDEIGSYGLTWGEGTPYASPDEARAAAFGDDVIEGEAFEVQE